MNKQKMLKINIIFLFVLMTWLAVTVVIRDIIGHEIFERIHPLGGFLFLISVAFHVNLNWGWVKKTYFSKE